VGKSTPSIRLHCIVLRKLSTGTALIIPLIILLLFNFTRRRVFCHRSEFQSINTNTILCFDGEVESRIHCLFCGTRPERCSGDLNTSETQN
jgi:hypothetical protein